MNFFLDFSQINWMIPFDIWNFIWARWQIDGFSDSIDILLMLNIIIPEIVLTITAFNSNNFFY